MCEVVAAGRISLRLANSLRRLGLGPQLFQRIGLASGKHRLRQIQESPHQVQCFGRRVARHLIDNCPALRFQIVDQRFPVLPVNERARPRGRGQAFPDLFGNLGGALRPSQCQTQQPFGRVWQGLWRSRFLRLSPSVVRQAVRRQVPPDWRCSVSSSPFCPQAHSTTHAGSGGKHVMTAAVRSSRSFTRRPCRFR